MSNSSNKTTLIGILAAVILALEPLIDNGNIDLKRDWVKLAFAVLSAVGGYLAKDADKSGLPEKRPARRKKRGTIGVFSLVLVAIIAFILMYCTGCNVLRKHDIRMSYAQDTFTLSVAKDVTDSAVNYRSRTERDKAVGVSASEAGIELLPEDLLPVTDANGKKADRTFSFDSGHSKGTLLIRKDGTARVTCKADSLTLVITGLVTDSTYQGRYRDSLRAVVVSDKQVIAEVNSTVIERGDPWWTKWLYGICGAIIGILAWAIIRKLWAITKVF